MAGPLARLYATLGLDAREFDAGLGKAQKSISGFGRGTDLAIAGVAGAVAGGLLSTVGAAREWETAFAGVRKTIDTTGLTAEQESAAFGKLEGELRGLAKTIPVTSTELAALAEAGGALGVARDDIVEFTRVTAMLGATTDVVSEDAAMSLGKIGTVLRLTAEDYDNFGNTLVDLGNKGASTESQILETANRIAGTASAVGLSASEMLGWSAALANVGILPEAAGSSFQRFAYTVQTAALMGGNKLEQLADIAGMTSAEFQTSWGRDVNATLASVVSGFGDLTETQALTAKGMLGFDDIRISDFMTKLTGNVDNLTDSLGISEQAWQDNTAMFDEFGKRAATVDSKVQVFWNKVNDLAITVGDVFLPVLASGTEHLGNLVSILGDAASAFPAVTSGVTLLVTALAGLTAMRFGARFLGLTALEPLIASGLGRAWTAGAAASKPVIAAAGAASAKVYAVALAVGQRLLAPLQAAWSMAMAVGSRVMVVAEATGMATGTRFAVGLAKGVTLVGIASILAQAFEDTFGGEGSFDAVENLKNRLAVDLAAKRPELRAELEEAGYDLGAGLAEGVAEGAGTALSSTGSFLSAFDSWKASVKGALASPLREEFDDTVDVIKVGIGSIKAALASPPQIISRQDRLENMAGRFRKIMKNLNESVEADDPYNKRYWAEAALAQQRRMNQITGNTEGGVGRIMRIFNKAGIAVDRDWVRMQLGATRTKGKVDNVGDAINGLPQNHNTNITVETGAAMRKILAFRNLLDNPIVTPWSTVRTGTGDRKDGASGATYFPGDWGWVGEHGPERIRNVGGAAQVRPSGIGSGDGAAPVTQNINLNVSGLPMRATTPTEVVQQVRRVARMGMLSTRREPRWAT